MHTDQTLWQVQGDPPADTESWEQGLALHIRHSPLTTIAVRIGDELRTYIALQGCGRCTRNACEVGCPTNLFHRLVQSSLPNGSLQRVQQPQGLAFQPYTAAMYCWPTPQAEPLSSTMLMAWPDTRLMMHWSGDGRSIRVGGLVMSLAPILAASLQERNWRTVPFARLLQRWLNQHIMPLPLPGSLWQGAPFVFSKSPDLSIERHS